MRVTQPLYGNTAEAPSFLSCILAAILLLFSLTLSAFSTEWGSHGSKSILSERPQEGAGRMRTLRTFSRGEYTPRSSRQRQRISPSKTPRSRRRPLVPFSQHIGAPAKPLVSVGDHVEEAQVIGESVGLSIGRCSFPHSRPGPRIQNHLSPQRRQDRSGGDRTLREVFPVRQALCSEAIGGVFPRKKYSAYSGIMASLGRVEQHFSKPCEILHPQRTRLRSISR